jgi:hypothetical protein
MHAIAKIVAARLTHTEIILVGERGLSVLSDANEGGNFMAEEIIIYGKGG